MAIPSFLRPIISWFAHHISRGLTALGLLPEARERYPGVAEERIGEAASLAETAVETAAEANRLRTDEPLANALRGREPPDEFVETRTLVTLRDAAGGIDDMLIRVTVPWNSTLGELLDIIEGAIRNRLQQSPGLAVVDVNFIPPMLLPPQ